MDSLAASIDWQATSPRTPALSMNLGSTDGPLSLSLSLPAATARQRGESEGESVPFRAGEGKQSLRLHRCSLAVVQQAELLDGGAAFLGGFLQDDLPAAGRAGSDVFRAVVQVENLRAAAPGLAFDDFI